MSRREMLVALVLGAAFAPALAHLAGVWAHSDVYSHGFLVPFVSLWLAHRERSRLAALPTRQEGWGLLLLAAAGLLVLAGILSAAPSLEGVSVVVAVAGAVAWLRGAAWLRALAFPLGFLLFMVPLPAAWLSPAVVELQLRVTQAALATLHLLGVAASRAGNVIELPGGASLFVAEACSGITSVVTLAPLALLVARLSELRAGATMLLLAAVVPVAMLANLLRVVGTVLAAGVFGVEAVTAGLPHTAAGLAVYVLGCLVLVVAARGLSPVPDRASG